MKKIVFFISAIFTSQYSLAQRVSCVSPECQDIVRNIAGDDSLIFLIEIFLFVIVVLGVVTYVHKKPEKPDKDRNDQ